MITFKSLRWKNLLSTGNAFTEISLFDTQNALIIGENGAGKSTILDALTFSLFGKPFRKINKPNLVNSINKKDCVVEVEFSTNNKEYKVIRGIKPNIFEIWCEGLCLNQDSASKDYQEHLEKFILKMNYKSFTQIVILGSASFTPFMQLSPADRRAVIEDLLDIQVFSVMNTIVKTRFQENKEKMERNRIALHGKEEMLDVITRTIETLKKSNEVSINQLTLEADEYVYQIEDLKRDIIFIEKEEDELKGKIDVGLNPRKIKSECEKIQAKIMTKLNRDLSEIQFYCENDACPTCKQSLENDFKQGKIEEAKQKASEYNAALDKLKEKLESAEKSIEKMDTLHNKLVMLSNKRNVIYASIRSYQKMANDIQEKINNTSDTALKDARKEHKEVMSEIETLKNEKQELFDDRQYIETAITLLKDGGIKTKIIKQYLPVINQKINKYLLQMGFFCNFQLNENFEETIKSRYRDDFSYQNFSEGEKMRINLAILLAWRAVAKLKNSVNTNILIFDEIFDSSLDVNGTDEFLKIMWSLVSDTNVFIISHKSDQMIDKFKKVYKFAKKRNFSVVIE